MGCPGCASWWPECPDMRHEAVRVLADGDLVAIHGRFIGLAETPLVGFDIYRVAQGCIVEHWDGLVPEAPPNASGHTQLDGTIGPGQGDAEANRAFITRFFTETPHRQRLFRFPALHRRHAFCPAQSPTSAMASMPWSAS